MTDPIASVSMGKVYLVGAGPGDPGLLTIKGKTLLETADVVVYDALVSEPILAMINPQAERIDAGKRRGRHSKLQAETTQLLIEKAQTAAIVVRLKGGDPFVFGRGGEEMFELLRSKVPVEVVPGVTAGIAAPAYAGIPLTHRDYSSSVVFVTGHESAGKYRPQVNWSAIADSAETIVIYMGVHNLSHIVPALIAAGRSPTDPVALIRWGTRPEQAELIATLATVCDRVAAVGFAAPAIAVIGPVVNFRADLAAIADPSRFAIPLTGWAIAPPLPPDGLPNSSPDLPAPIAPPTPPEISAEIVSTGDDRAPAAVE